VRFLVDENMPRSLAPQIAARGVQVADVRDIGLSGRPDEEIFAAASSQDAIVITRDRGFTLVRNWPAHFTAGVIFVNLPDDMSAGGINSKVLELITKRSSKSLLGGVTFLERGRALTRIVRKRP